MPRPLEEYVKQVLAEHNRGDKICQALEHGMAKMKAAPDWAVWRRKSTGRHIFWEAAVDRLIELTADDPGLHVIEHHDTVSFVFDEAVLVRLKKAAMSLRTSNYPTPTAELFDCHEADLFGFTGLQRVEAVYVLNRFETDIIWMGIVAHEEGADLWHFELAPAAVPTETLPKPAHPPAAELARLKNQGKEKKRKKTEDDE